mmetsp:Transcript_124646/g.364014  ORF Transcript_124646/g.364014 Transcript_124646/m.364014 type:complete len:423 (-) Transcript_124646:58-1326(-)
MMSFGLFLISSTLVACLARVDCGLERIAYTGGDTTALLQQYRKRQVPLIVSNLTSHWRAHAQWDQLEFARRYGNLTVRTERQVAYGSKEEHKDSDMMTLSSMISGSRQDRIALSFMLPFGSSRLTNALRGDVVPLPTAFETLTSEPIFTLGRKDTGADFHAHTDVWSAQVRGRKMWLLAPPGTKRLPKGLLPCTILRMRHRRELEQQLENCTVHPGEVLYLPSRWQHDTCNLDDFTVGVGGRGRSSSSHAACNYCDLPALRRAAEEDPGSLHAWDYYDRQPLHVCAWVECLEGVEFLADRGVNVSAVTGKGIKSGDEGSHALHLTYCNKPAIADSIAKVLLAHGADPGADSPHCGTILHAAAVHGNLELVKLLLRLGADPSEVKFGASPLELAEQNRHRSVAKYLRQHLARRKRRATAGGDL